MINFTAELNAWKKPCPDQIHSTTLPVLSRTLSLLHGEQKTQPGLPKVPQLPGEYLGHHLRVKRTFAPQGHFSSNKRTDLETNQSPLQEFR